MSIIRYTVLLGVLSLLNFTSQNNEIALKLSEVKIKVTDMKQALDFYSFALGFPIDSIDEDSSVASLTSRQLPITLVTVRGEPKQVNRHQTQAKIAFQANQLLPAIDRLRANGVKFIDESLSRNGIGIAILFNDPFGNIHSLVEVQISDVPQFIEPRIYNAGFDIPDMGQGEDFYCNLLGFEVWSRNYLPAALPLRHRDGSFAFMLHHKKGVKMVEPDPNSPGTILVYTTSDLSKALNLLSSTDVRIIEKRSNSFTMADPFGNISEVTVE